MMETKIGQHVWVKHTITPVEVVSGLSGEPVVFVDPEVQAESEQITTVYGCGVCYEPLATAFNTNCMGAIDEPPLS